MSAHAGSDGASRRALLSSWSDDPHYQDLTFEALAGAYAVVAVVAVVQLVRIHLRVPEYGWTTQKVFHLLNFLCSGFRAIVFPLRRAIEDAIRPPILADVLFDLPGLLFFTTYLLLVLFWAEIYHQARSLPTEALRPVFSAVNACAYAFQMGLWLWASLVPSDAAVLKKVSALLLAVASFVAAAGFVLYGGRLFAMLRRFPIESKGRRKKLREVGAVTGVCATCFLTRAALVCVSTFRNTLRLDVAGHPGLNALYYGLCEITPSALVLFILRKLPPKSAEAGGGGGGAEDEETDAEADEEEGAGGGRYRRLDGGEARGGE